MLAVTTVRSSANIISQPKRIKDIFFSKSLFHFSHFLRSTPTPLSLFLSLKEIIHVVQVNIFNASVSICKNVTGEVSFFFSSFVKTKDVVTKTQNPDFPNKRYFGKREWCFYCDVGAQQGNDLKKERSKLDSLFYNLYKLAAGLNFSSVVLTFVIPYLSFCCQT